MSETRILYFDREFKPVPPSSPDMYYAKELAFGVDGKLLRSTLYRIAEEELEEGEDNGPAIPD